MNRLVVLLACLVAAFSLFYVSSRTPVPRPLTASPDGFSAARALADIAVMAPVPHPVGSPANARVRDHLVSRMTALGLSPRVSRAESHRARTFGGETYMGGAVVENIVGVLPGRNRGLPALALMAHYDSVPGSPGAADDSAGVASILEIVRATETTGTPARDVIVAITDGEEAGLLGANAFFAEDPLAPHVGFVLNLETRGGGGRASMFETGAQNGAAMEVYRQSAVRPFANSLTGFIYKLLPNGTDYSIAKARGLPGFNYAFIGRQFDYHSPSSTLAALDAGAVQHMGDEVLGTAKALAFAATLPGRAPDAVYGDLFGLTLVAYPAWAGWLVLAAAGGLIQLAARRARREFSWMEVLRGVGAALLLILLGGLTLYLTRLATGAAFGFTEQRPILARFALFEVAMAASGVGVVVFVAAALKTRRARIAGVWTGLLLTGLAGALALQILAPTTAFVIAWPLLAAGAISALTAAGTRLKGVSAVIGLALAAVAMAWLASFFHAILQALDVPFAPAVIVWLAAMVAWPLLWPTGATSRRDLFVGAVTLASGLGLALWMHATDPWTARHPQAAEPLYVVEPAAGKAWRASPVQIGPWARAVLTADGGALGRRAFPTFADPMSAAPAKFVTAVEPAITVTRGADGRETLRVPISPGSTSLRLDVRADTAVSKVEVNGKPTPILGSPGRWTHVRWQGPAEPLVIAFTPAGPGRLDLRYAVYLDHWPVEARPLPVMPPDVDAWDRSGSTVVVGSRQRRW